MNEKVTKNGARNVLLAEDDEFLAKTLEAKLIQEGFDVVIVSDGRDVIKVLSGGSFNLILLDLLMPNMSGFDILSKLREQRSVIPVIVTSNLGSDSDMERAKALGAKKYFVKADSSTSDIVDGVKSVLRGG